MTLLTVYGPARLKSSFLDGPVHQKCLVKSHTLSPTPNLISILRVYIVGR